MSTKQSLVFGIYPGGSAGGDTGLLSGLPNAPDQVIACLEELQGESQPFVVRCYDSFQDPDSPLWGVACAPENYVQYAVPGRRPLELVLQFRSASGDVSGYLNFVRGKVVQCHQHLYAVQITEEANFVNGPKVIDGPYPNVRKALIEGIIAAKETLIALGRDDVKVGFNTTPTFGPHVEFWGSLKSLAGRGFTEALDYVGLDFFPDVFRPLAPDGQPGDLKNSVRDALETLRHVWLPAAGIAEDVPIHITEHGWPTGGRRSANRQAEVLEAVIRTIHELSGRLNIARYMLFDLRDVDREGENGNDNDNVFRFFGITAADYRHKPAFQKFQNLVRELGARGSQI